MGSMNRYFDRVRSSKSFRKKEEEKRKYATSKGKKKSDRGCPSEYQEHTAIVSALRKTGARFLHPNNNARSAVAGRKARAMGMVRGASDLIVFTSPPSRPDKKGVCLEVKALDGKPTKDQVEWLQGMHEEGYLCYVVWGCAAGISILTSLGYIKESRDDSRSNAEGERIPGEKRKRKPCYQEIQGVSSGDRADSERSRQGDGDERGNVKPLLKRRAPSRIKKSQDGI